MEIADRRLWSSDRLMPVRGDARVPGGRSTTAFVSFCSPPGTGGSIARQRQGAYLARVIAAGRHAHLTAALTGGPLVPAPGFEDMMSRVLVGLLKK
jgi:hypothetical protein